MLYFSLHLSMEERVGAAADLDRLFQLEFRLVGVLKEEPEGIAGVMVGAVVHWDST
jgi:hypothetical protein